MKIVKFFFLYSIINWSIFYLYSIKMFILKFDLNIQFVYTPMFAKDYVAHNGVLSLVFCSVILMSAHNSKTSYFLLFDVYFESIQYLLEQVENVYACSLTYGTS